MSYFQQSAIKRGLFIIVCFSLHCILSVPSFAEGQEQYLLITNEYLQESFQPLVDRRCSQGMDGTLITVQDINDSTLYSGKDIQERIRSCVQSHYDPNRSMYLVLGGDESVVPPRYCETGNGYVPPVDLYYADMDGTHWDADGDNIYGERGDIGLEEITPEISFGRIPVCEPEHVTAYYHKIVQYEDEIDEEEFIDSMLMLSGVGYDHYYEGPQRPDRFRDHDPVSSIEVDMTDRFLDIIQPYWQPGELKLFFDTNTSWDTHRFGDYDITVQNIKNVLNSGVHYVYFWQHSNAFNWTFVDDDTNVWFNARDGKKLSNQLPFIVFARGCGTAYYDKEGTSLSEALLQNPNGGAIAVLGNSRSIAGSPHQDQILRNMFQEDHLRIGDAHRACLEELAPIKVSDPWHQYIFLLLGDPALSCRRQTKKTLQIFSPRGNEVIDAGSDLCVRWNAAGSFSPEETVFLEYSDDDGGSWHAIPEANDLHYNAGSCTWSDCPLPSGTDYRVRVSSTSEPLLYSDTSEKSFTIARMGELTVKSSPLYKVRIDGTYSSRTEFICSAIRNRDFQLVAPQNVGEFEFSGWMDANGVLLSDSNELQFVFDHNTTITAQYDYPGEGITYYINDEIGEDGIAVGDDNNNGLLPDTPMASIQVLLDRYPEIGYEDTIYISDGRYFENIFIDVNHTGVTFMGQGHEVTIIDGGDTARCVGVGSEVICHFRNIGFEHGNDAGGGALYLGNGQITCTIHNCRFEDNSSSKKGGAITAAGSPALVGLEVHNSMFVGNEGNNGSAISLKQDIHVEFYDCVFQDNTSNKAGALVVAMQSSARLEDCVFIGNTTNTVGGAITVRNSGRSIAKRCRFENNEAIQGGGAIALLYNAQAFVSQSEFMSNTSYDAGAFIVEGESSARLEECLFIGNTSNTVGGAITVLDSGGIITTRCTFENNEAIEGGGAIALYDNVQVSVSQSVFMSNTSKYGGAIVAEHVSRGVDIDDCLFDGNLALNSGGAIQISGEGLCQIRSTTFKNNSARTGGAIVTASTSSSEYDKCIFDNNTSLNGGGGLLTTEFSMANLKRSIFTNNAGSKGGGLGVHHTSNVSAQHCLFTGNNAVKAGGAISIHASGMFSAQNCTMTANSSNGGGGVAWYSTNDLMLVNCIIADNASGGWSDLRLQGDGTAFVSYCCIPVECDGAGNTTEAPLFRNEDANDYRLAAGSPCIDAGSPETADFVDLDGIPGPVDGDHDGSVVTDIGAYEFSSSH